MMSSNEKKPSPIEFNLGEIFPKICIIGTGFSGLCAAVQLQRKLNQTDFTVYEMNEEVGGAWFSNRFPGCACDIQSHLYSYSFFPKPDWSKDFAAQPEILEYMKSVAKKFEVYKHIKFRHKILQLKWEDKLLKWKVTVMDLINQEQQVAYYDIVVNGSGELRIPQIPQEFKEFTGPSIHSAEWDPSIKLEGKTVAIIGSGATAIQLIPSLIPKKVGKLLCYQRQAAWVLPAFQTTFSPFTKWSFANIPGLQVAYRRLQFLMNEFMFPAFQYQTVLAKLGNRIGVTLGKDHVKRQIKNPELRQQLIPKYKFGCKRVGISNKYYPALNLPHVKVITSKIDKVSESSIKTVDGKENHIDVLILATGFRVYDFFAPMEIIGRNEENILDSWKTNGPSGYLGITSHSQPNLFTLLGPGSDVNHNSGIFQIECQVNWMIKIIKEMKKREARCFAVTKMAELNYMKKMREAMMKTIYGNFNCGSWFTNENNIVTALYPKSSISYWYNTKIINFNHFDFSHK